MNRQFQNPPYAWNPVSLYIKSHSNRSIHFSFVFIMLFVNLENELRNRKFLVNGFYSVTKAECIILLCHSKVI